jgi:hypothetical protein
MYNALFWLSYNRYKIILGGNSSGGIGGVVIDYNHFKRRFRLFSDRV